MKPAMKQQAMKKERHIIAAPMAIIFFMLLLSCVFTKGMAIAQSISHNAEFYALQVQQGEKSGTQTGESRAVHPLKPPDRSSPRATLQTFLKFADATAAFLAGEYRTTPTLEGFHRLRSLARVAVECLDLSEIPPAARDKLGPYAAMALYETLSKIELPEFNDIPGADQLKLLAATDPPRWVIPNTEITLVRVKHGPRAGEFLFSASTVAKSDEFYQRLRGLPYTRPIPLKNPYELAAARGGWMVPFSWIQAMPEWLRTPILGQSVWKWVALVIVIAFYALILGFAVWLSRRGSGNHPFLLALARLALPVIILLAAPAVAYVALAQINIIGEVGGVIELVTTATIYLASAWLSWRIAAVIAESIIASPHIAPQSIDAHLIRICARLLGIFGGAALLAMGADRLGVPLYGIVAGLGVGGLALALAAQPSIENLIGGLSLFADKPIAVGDFGKYGDSLGTVEEIGLRSTRIRGPDRTLTSIPNATLSKMPIVNYAQRDCVLIRTVIGVRYETTSDQLRYVLATLRQMLLGHPRIDPESARVRFVGFGASSLDIEVFAYAMTRDWLEFLCIREDVFLRVIDIIEQSGAAIAFPSQTVYFSRDGGLDEGKTRAAESQVRQWREEDRLPFPNFSPDQVSQIRGSVIYPPPGSTEAPTEK
ncbi:MAG TPA: mechanosensitive ion channel family protein [Candidatus Binatia bacterium]|nr:mechanosensitive ion channel family protein [Candidatus Binatia bacterium]